MTEQEKLDYLEKEKEKELQIQKQREINIEIQKKIDEQKKLNETNEEVI